MGIFERLKPGQEYKWIWYLGTLFGSLLPMIIRLVISMDHKIPCFDLKDFLFAGLAMNLSNLNLIGTKSFKYKTEIALFSTACIVIIAAVIGVLFADEANTEKNNLFGIKALSLLFVSLSIYVSFEANNFVFKKERL